jgi:hypothetical protein
VDFRVFFFIGREENIRAGLCERLENARLFIEDGRVASPASARPSTKNRSPAMKSPFFAVAMVLALGFVARADEPAKPSSPTEIDATDKAALDAAANQDVVNKRTITRARWSASGKVMTVEFDDSPLLAAVFEKNKDAVNAAFEGDAAKKWTGAKVKLKGKLGKYGGPQKSYADRPQIVITKADQVTIVEAAAKPAKKE